MGPTCGWSVGLQPRKGQSYGQVIFATKMTLPGSMPSLKIIFSCELKSLVVWQAMIWVFLYPGPQLVYHVVLQCGERMELSGTFLSLVR